MVQSSSFLLICLLDYNWAHAALHTGNFFVKYMAVVKNGFSNPTKVQMDQDQYRIAVMNDLGGRLSERSVVKENKLRWMCLQ